MPVAREIKLPVGLLHTVRVVPVTVDAVPPSSQHLFAVIVCHQRNMFPGR